MYKNLVVLLLLVHTTFIVKAQIEIDLPERYYLNQKNFYQGEGDENKNTMSLHGNYEINSNAVTNSFVKTLLTGKFINDGIKDDVSKKLKSKNRAGLDNSYGLTGTHRIDDVTIVAGLNFREHLDIGFSKDLFEVLLRGNKAYADKTVNLGPSQVNYFNYQSIFLGFSRKMLDKPIILGGGISLIRGGQYQRLDIKKANLYTEQSGEYLQLDTQFSMDFTSPQSSYLASSGAGAAFNLSFYREGEKGIWNAELRDAGFIYWHDVNSVKADSSFHYEGRDIKNVLNYGNYTYNSINLDSIREDFHIRKENTKTFRKLPFTFNINYTYLLSEKIHLMGGVRYLAFANYAPRAYVKGFFKIRERFMLTPGLLYGGYGNLNLELSATKSFNDKFLVSGSVVCLEYLLIPKQSQGLALQLNLTKIF